jgi:hypothetical protein
MSATLKKLTEDEYLAIESSGEFKSEFYNGDTSDASFTTPGP